MLAARDQENLVSRHHNGAALKQQQNNQPGSRFPKTPVKIPLNDENAGHMKGGAKSILGNRTRGNENVPTSKGLKGLDKSNFVTPMEPRTRAVLGNKTTNAKTRGLQTVNVKSAIKEIEKTQGKAPNTIRPKQKQPQAEIQRLQVHAEESDPLGEEEPEYCPPKPKELPYESDVIPAGTLTFEGLKPENLFKGYYQYYHNPVDENGVSKADKELAKSNRNVMEECDRQVKEDIENFEWAIQDEIDAAQTDTQAPPTTDPAKPKYGHSIQLARKPLSTVTSKDAAAALSMDDATKSWQRKIAKPIPVPDPKKKTTSFAIPRFRGARQPTSHPTGLPRKTSMEIRNIEANSRSTLGYNKGRAAASVLATGTTKPGAPKPGHGPFKPKAIGLPRSATVLSTDSDKTITPARYANKQTSAATEDQEWKERVPFLSIFSPEDDDGYDLVGPGGLPDLEDDEEFEMKLSE
ncbi:hypothetical protein BJ170DRAFT_126713 [Xylariales sp. AK1849]|nr:hypothetical protein BJ170DRAFT_126713 [Xylariales sp. AK1849]